MPEKSFNPADWYWGVTGNPNVYSSARGDYFPTTDPTYVAWKNSGGLGTRIDTEFNLGQVLASYINQLTTTTSTSLVIQQALKQAQLDAAFPPHMDTVLMAKGGRSTTLTGTDIANFLAQSANNYRSLKSQIALATTAAQVQAIDITAGWPANP